MIKEVIMKTSMKNLIYREGRTNHSNYGMKLVLKNK